MKKLAALLLALTAHSLLGGSASFTGSGSSSFAGAGVGYAGFTAARLAAPETVEVGTNGINLNVDVVFAFVDGADYYEYSYDETDTWETVVATGPAFEPNELHTLGPAGLHVVKIRGATFYGIPGFSGTSNVMVLVGP